MALTAQELKPLQRARKFRSCTKSVERRGVKDGRRGNFDFLWGENNGNWKGGKTEWEENRFSNRD